MKWFPILLYLFIQIYSGKSISRMDENLLPTIFKITNVEACPISHLYCKLIVKLRERDDKTPSEMWNAIEKVNKEKPLNYRRDIIYRTVCIQNNELKKEFNEYINNGLVGWVDKSYCYERTSSGELTSHDKYFGLAVLSYIAFLVYCTIKTNYSNESTENNSSVTVNKYIKIFSITNTWKEINKPNRGEDFNKLLSIQGMRTFTMCIVIFSHNLMILVFTYCYNPEYIEQHADDKYYGFLFNSFGLLVQIFFIISAWLLAVQLNNIVKRNGQITIKDIAIISLNRYFRLIPCVIVLMLFSQLPAAGNILSEPLYRSHVELEQNRCRNNWWMNIFFIQNWSYLGRDMCNPGTWYLAADTQLYLMIVLFFYLSKKFKISIKYFLGSAAVIAMCLQGYTVMTTTFEGLLQFNPSMLPAETAFSSPEFVISYTRTEGSLVTYVIGFIFGSIYVENKHRDIFNTPMKKILWFASFFGLPFITILFYNYHHSWRVIEAIMAISFRPLFSLGIAIGILGMATNTGGFIKKFFEWRPLVFMGNFSYSVYIFQFIVMVFRLTQVTHMIYFNNFTSVKLLIQDMVTSFIAGTVMYVIFEHPCVQLQKMVLPQVKTTKEETKGKDS